MSGTEDMAKKLFNTTDVLGKAIKVNNDSTLYKITAVQKDFPANSHLSFNLLFSESSVPGDEFKKFVNSDWTSNNFRTYLLLNGKASVRDAEQKSTGLLQLIKAVISRKKVVTSCSR